MRNIGVITRLTAAFIACLPGASPAGAQHEQHSAGSASAQSFVSGRVVCEDGLPLPQAVVQAWHIDGAERHPYSGVLTDEAGRFAFRAAPGSYFLRVSYIGHSADETTISIASAPLSLGDVQLAITAIELEALTIAAQREGVRLRSGATVVEADAGPTAGGTVADVLRTVPGIESDPEGRLTMRGSAGVLVLIDGRPTVLEGDALVAFLRQMPASALERIETGTVASAAQDAEGSAGVVNLVFRNSRSTPDMRSVAASVGTEDHYLVNGMLGGGVGTAAAWDASYSFSSMRPRTESRTLRTTWQGADTAGLSDQSSDARARHRLHSVGAGVGARIAPSLSAAARASFARMEGSFRNRTAFDQTAAGASTQETTLSRLNHVIPSASTSLSLDWNVSGRVLLRTDFRASGADEDFRGDYRDPDGVTLLRREMDARQREYGTRSDLSLTLGRTRWNVGQAYTRRTIDASYATTASDSASAAFHYRNDIAAAYAAARFDGGALAVEAGTRVERDATRLNRAGSNERVDWRAFPSLQGWWTPSQEGRFRYRAALGRRIDRPDFASLNPYSMGEDDMNSIVGNPELRPEVTDQLELGVEYHGATSLLQLTPFLRRTRDPIRPLKFVTESGHSTTTLHNLERASAAGLDGNLRLGLGDRTTVTLSGSIAHIDTEGLDYANSGVSMSARAHVDLEVTDDGLLQLYAYRRGAQAIEQGEILPAMTTELAFTQRWGDEDQGRFTIRLSDPFRTDELAFRVAERGFAQETWRRVSRPLLSAFVSWAVGADPVSEERREEEAPSIF